MTRKSKQNPQRDLRILLQTHSRVEFEKFLPTNHIKQQLETQDPATSAFVLLKILDRFTRDVQLYNEKNTLWDTETLDDAMELLQIQITQQYH